MNWVIEEDLIETLVTEVGAGGTPVHPLELERAVKGVSHRNHCFLFVFLFFSPQALNVLFCIGR